MMHNREKWKGINKDIDNLIPSNTEVSVATVRLNVYLSSLKMAFKVWNYSLHIFPSNKEIFLELNFPQDRTTYTKTIKCSFIPPTEEYETEKQTSSPEKAYEYAMGVI